MIITEKERLRREKISRTLTGFKRPPFSKEHIAKMSAKSKGRKMLEDNKKKLSERMKGNSFAKGFKHTEEWKRLAKLRKPSLGLKATQETRNKISASKKKNPTKYWLGRKRPDMAEIFRKYNTGRLGELAHNWKGGVTKDPVKLSWLKNKRNRDKRTNGGLHSLGDWENLKAQYNWTCPCCKQSEPTIKLTEDHIIPVSKGGSDNIENIQPLCKSCNCKKHNKEIKYEQ